MFKNVERRDRYRECLELEAHHGPFLPCEAYADPEDRRRDGAASERPALATLMAAVLKSGLRAARDIFRMT